MKNSSEGARVISGNETQKTNDLENLKSLLSGPTVEGLLNRKINSVKDLSDLDLNSMKKLTEYLEQQLHGVGKDLQNMIKYLISGLKKIIEEREKYASYLDKPDSDFLIGERISILQQDLRDLKRAIEQGQ